MSTLEKGMKDELLSGHELFKVLVTTARNRVSEEKLRLMSEPAINQPQPLLSEPIPEPIPQAVPPPSASELETLQSLLSNVDCSRCRELTNTNSKVHPHSVGTNNRNSPYKPFSTQNLENPSSTGNYTPASPTKHSQIHPEYQPTSSSHRTISSSSAVPRRHPLPQNPHLSTPQNPQNGSCSHLSPAPHSTSSRQ